MVNGLTQGNAAKLLPPLLLSSGESPEGLGTAKPPLLLGLENSWMQAEHGEEPTHNLSCSSWASYSTGNKCRLGGICWCNSETFFFFFIFIFLFFFDLFLGSDILGYESQSGSYL